MRVLIVEDERLSAARLEKLLGNFPDVEVLAVASDGREAVDMIDAMRPDAVFLDVELPELDGFGVLRETTHGCPVVFTTAYDEFAVRAFEEEGIDYLLKPVELQRLKKAVARLRAAVKENSSERRADIFPVKAGEDMHIVRREEIFFFRSEDRYVFLYTYDGRYFFDMNLRQLEDMLDPSKFLRIHRNTIVALDKIVSVKKWFLGELNIGLKDKEGTVLKAGKTYVKKVREVLGL